MTPLLHGSRHRAGRSVAFIAAGALAAGALPLLALATSASAAPDDAVWTPVAGRASSSHDGNARTVNPSKYRAYRLDDVALGRALSRAPQEKAAGAAPVTVSVPAPNGDLVEFAVRESPVMEAGLAAAHPEISTYAGTSTAEGSSASIRLDVTPAGFHASVLGDGAAWYVDPAFRNDDSLYLSYLGSDVPKSELPLVEPELPEKARKDVESLGEAPGQAVTERTYRLALLTDPSYAEYVAPGLNDGTQDAASNAAVLAAKVTLMNRVNQIYTNDLAIKMVLIDDTDKLNLNNYAKATGANGPCGATACYTTAQLDPAATTTNGCTGGLLTRNRFVIGQLVGADKFDIGHIGLGINGGGIASLGVVGGNAKAQGCTGLPQPVGDFYAIDYVAHEMGHQFSGNHTFNGSQANCSTTNRSAAASVEPGSGSSVMAYAGICGSDDLQPHTDPYFSQRSQTEIGAYAQSTVANVTEVQEAAFTGFTTNGNAFTLTFPGLGTTVPIVRGTASAGQQPYTAAGIKAAVEAVTSGTVTVTGFFAANGTPSDSGFTMSFGGTLAGTDVPTPTLTVTSGTYTGYVNAIANGGAPTNGGSTLVTSENHAPRVTAPAGKFIPVRTPFTLTGSGEDVDGDELIYLWEQNDQGAAGNASGIGLVTQPKLNGPLFRVFGDYADVTPAGTLEYNSPGENLATTNPSRTFPDMAQILAGNTNAATGSCPTPQATDYKNGVSGALVDGPVLDCFSESLPTALYLGSAAAGNLEPSLNFRLTARDQDVTAGGYQFADVKLRLDRTAGPFLVTSQAAATSYEAGSTQTITWDVNGTNKASLAPNVKITLSTDGGQTFDTVLADSVPNNGSATVTIPSTLTTDGRIKIEAVGNYFFDVNDAPITITGTFTVDDQVPDTVSTQYSDPVDASFDVSSDFAAYDDLTATPTGLPEGLSLTKTGTAGGPPSSATFTVTGNVTDAPGSYPVSIAVSDGTNQDTVDFTVEVAKEDATVTYTGPDSVVAPQGGDDAVEVTATASVEEDDETPGDLTLATATFTDTTTDEVLCAAAPVTAAGSTSCTFDADLPADAGRDYAIDVTLGSDYYAGATEEPGALSVTIEDDAPETTITSGPLDGSVVLSDEATFTFTSSEAGSTFVCTLDGDEVPCADGTAVLSGLSPSTHLFTVAASDANGNTDASPASASWTVPLDDRNLARRGGGWDRAAGNKAYLNTLTKADNKGATLSYEATDMTGLALVAPTRATDGGVRVYLDGERLAYQSLKSDSSRNRRLLPIAAFDEPVSGTITIVTASDAKVRIDGLVVINPTSRRR